MNILETIVQQKIKEVKNKKLSKPERFKNAIDTSGVSIIAEIKLTSPSEGVLGNKKDIPNLIKQYREGGSDAISIVTDTIYFGGDISLVSFVRQHTAQPILVKDFIIEECQLVEIARQNADAVLLIAKIVRSEQLIQLVDRAILLGLEPIVEIYTEEELRNALKTKAQCIAVNARNLDDFSIDIDRACLLLSQIPTDKIAIGFSGIKTKEDIKKYKNVGAKAVLVGTSLMKSTNCKVFLEELKNV